MQNSELTDEELLSLLKNNDHAAFEHIYRRYWKSLFRQLYAKSGNVELAEELTQTIFVSIWERRTSLCVQHLPSYLDAAARFSFINHIRSIAKEIRYADAQKANENSTQEANSLNTLNVEEITSQLHQALNHLPKKTQEVFLMSRMEYQPIKKIAQALQLSEKAVEYHITKSLKTLRIALRDYLTIGAIFTLYHLYEVFSLI